MPDLTLLNEITVCDGKQRVYKHFSDTTKCDMEFSVFLPERALNGEKLPVLWYLSGLTCTWANVTEKAGAQRYCAEHGLIFIAPDTSPRGDGIPDDDNAAYDFGLGAGFYVNATQAPWAAHYQMYDYIVKELQELACHSLPIDTDRQGITGHSMGGHGALSIALKNQKLYRSVSAFAPIVNPIDVPWGQKALSGYLGEDQTKWEAYDSLRLMTQYGWHSDILIDQGNGDNFLNTQLQPSAFAQACEEKSVPLSLNLREGYDHSYYFISSFIGDHIKWHIERLLD